MIVNSEGIVIKERKIANNRRIIVLFTKKYGIISAGTSYNESGKKKSALPLKPFTYSEYELYKGRDYYNINSASIIKSYYSIAEDIDRFFISSSILVLIYKILEEDVANQKLFDLTIDFFDVITSMENGDIRAYQTLLCAYLTKVIKMMGVMPELDSCVNCGKKKEEFGRVVIDSKGKEKLLKNFSISSGGIICEDCERIERDNPASLIYSPSFDIITLIKFFVEKPLKALQNTRLKQSVLDEIKIILTRYVKSYLGVEISDEPMKWR